MVNRLLRARKMLPLYGQTEDLNARPEVEICQWLDRHREIVRWVVLDDMDLEVRDTEHAKRMRGRCVKPYKHVGLTAWDAELAISILTSSGTTMPPSSHRSHTATPRVSQLTEEEAERCALSEAAEGKNWEELRGGDFARMERFFE